MCGISNANQVRANLTGSAALSCGCVIPMCSMRHSTHVATVQLDEYREQSELLDPLLERLVSPLAVVLRAAAAAGPASHDLAGLRGASRLLWAVATTR